jgi:Zn-dependent protease
MQSTSQGSIRLFRFAGIDVFLHWSWFVVAALEISARGRRYPSIAWNIAEYLALFLIVTLHEFGHALACRQVGGTANKIMLWPLGGVAYVDPPPRPAATLWSIFQLADHQEPALSERRRSVDSAQANGGRTRSAGINRAQSVLIR